MDFSLVFCFFAVLISFVDRSFCHFPRTNVSLACDNIFEGMQKCQLDFVESSMKNSDPFLICTNNFTFISHRITIAFYDKLFTTFDIHNASLTCAEKFLNKNHMNVVVNFISFSKNLWTTANCDDCYEMPASLTQNFSSNTKAFIKSHDIYDECVRNTTEFKLNSTVCIECDGFYQNLNNLYEHNKKTSENKICFDLEDRMNKTRRDWSVKYKCCKGKRDSLTAFYSLAAAVFTIAVGFYGAVYVVGAKYPDTEPLDDREVSGRRESETEAAGPSRATQPERKMIINQDDSDDEILIGSSPKLQQNQNLIALDN